MALSGNGFARKSALICETGDIMTQIFTQVCTLLATSGLLATLALAGSPHESRKVHNASPIEAKAGERSMRLHIDSRSLFKTPRSPALLSPDDRSISRLPINGPELYGSVINSDGIPGLYLLPASSSASMTMKIPGVKAQSALLINGQYYAINPGNYYDAPSVKIYDMATGSEVSTWTGSYNDVSLKNYGIDQDPVSGDIYGVFYDEDAYHIELAKVSFNGAVMSRTQTIGTLSEASVWYGFAFDKEGQLWGIAGDSYDYAYLYKIDKTTAAMTLVGSTGYEPTYNTSACFDRDNDVLYWSVATESGYYEVGYLTTVNLSTGKATKIYEYPNAEVVGGMVIPGSSASADAPGECSDVKAIFENGSLAGNISLVAPSRLQDGSAGSGELTIKVRSGDDMIASQAAEWGAEVLIPISIGEPGIYNFTVCASNQNGDGKGTVLNNIFIGADAPQAPAVRLTYDNGVMNLSWTPVTESVNGGWIDLEALSYTVIRFPDNIEVASGLTETSFSEEIVEPEVSTHYYYEVVAVCGEMMSAAARSNMIALGAIVPAYTSDFAADGLEGFTVIDANDDRNKWELYSDGGDVEVRIRYNSDLDMDDWLITPAVRLEAGRSYKFSVLAHNHSSSFPERLEVMYGDAPEVGAMTNVIIPATEITTKFNKTYEGTIIATESGKYYIGFHGISEADNYYLYISEFSIEEGEILAVPAAPADFTVIPANDCSTHADISLTAPTIDIYGDELTELDKVEVYRNGELVKTFDTVGPGEELGYTDFVSDNMEYTYAAYAYNSFGKSEAASVTAYIGVRLPGTPTNIKAQRTSNVGEVMFTWDPVVVDENGNALNPELVSYIVGVPSGDEFEIISNVLDSNSFTYTFVEEGSQDLVRAVVFPVTAAGTGLGAYAPIIPAGTPYDAFHESFAFGASDMLWYMDSSGGGHWGFLSDSSGITAPDGDNGMIAMQGSKIDDNADLISGLVNLGAFEYPALSFQVYNQTSGDTGYNANVLMVSVLVDGQYNPSCVFEKTIGDIASPKSWGTVNVDLTAYEGKNVQVIFTVIVKMYQTTVLDDIRIESQQVTYPAPQNLTARDGVKCVDLSWEVPAFDPESPVRPEHIVGYKVYRDNMPAHDGILESTRHEDYEVESEKSYTYHVTALYTHGESEPSDKVLHNFNSGISGIGNTGTAVFVNGTDIVIDNAEGQNISIADVSGHIVYDGTGAFRTIVKVSKGVYVATVGDRTFKLIVK